MEFRLGPAIIQAYQAHTIREIRGDNEYLSNRAKHMEAVEALKQKELDVAEKIRQEAARTRPDLKRLDRMYKILKNIQGTLANCKVK